MIEILIIIAVVGMFTRKAKQKGLHRGLWGFIGAASYYVPILFMGLLILPTLIESGLITFQSESSALIIAVVVNLLTGILCCFFAYRYLLSIKSKTALSEEALDGSLIERKD